VSYGRHHRFISRSRHTMAYVHPGKAGWHTHLGTMPDVTPSALLAVLHHEDLHAALETIGESEASQALDHPERRMDCITGDPDPWFTFAYRLSTWVRALGVRR
jgi:hypothetical protein